MRAANLFDLRRIIAGVFGVWGVLLVILGLTESDAEIERAAGVNINLWAGLGMLAISLVFTVWALTRPLGEELAEDDGRRAARQTQPRPAGRARPRRRRRGAPAPGGNSARTEPPKPPPTMRAPAAPASLHAATAASTSGTLAS